MDLKAYSELFLSLAKGRGTDLPEATQKALVGRFAALRLKTFPNLESASKAILESLWAEYVDVPDLEFTSKNGEIKRPLGQTDPDNPLGDIIFINGAGLVVFWETGSDGVKINPRLMIRK